MQFPRPYYLIEIVPVHIGIIAIGAVIIPSILMYIMIAAKFNNKLESREYQRSYGVLFMELNQNLYLWDFLTMVVKISIVVLSVLYKHEIIIKACLMTIILALYEVVCFRYQPYKNIYLNHLQQFGTIVQALSIILRMCSDTLNPHDETLFEHIAPILIIILNISFFLHMFYLVFMDFRHKIRLIFGTCFNKFAIGKKILLKIKQERKAKVRWYKIREAILNTNYVNKKGYLIDQYTSKFYVEGLKMFKPNFVSPFAQNLNLIKCSDLVVSNHVQSQYYSNQPPPRQDSGEIKPKKLRMTLSINESQYVDVSKNLGGGKFIPIIEEKDFETDSHKIYKNKLQNSQFSGSVSQVEDMELKEEAMETAQPSSPFNQNAFEQQYIENNKISNIPTYNHLKSRSPPDSRPDSISSITSVKNQNSARNEQPSNLQQLSNEHNNKQKQQQDNQSQINGSKVNKTNGQQFQQNVEENNQSFCNNSYMTYRNNDCTMSAIKKTEGDEFEAPQGSELRASQNSFCHSNVGDYFENITFDQIEEQQNNNQLTPTIEHSKRNLISTDRDKE